MAEDSAPQWGQFANNVCARGWTDAVVKCAKKTYPTGPKDQIDSWFLDGHFNIPINCIRQGNYREQRQWVVDKLKENIKGGWKRTSILIVCFMGVNQTTGQAQFKLVDGGHRYQALVELAAAGQIPPNFAPPCLILYHNTPPMLMHAEAERQNDQNSDFAEVSFTDRLCSINKLQAHYMSEVSTQGRYATVEQLSAYQSAGSRLATSHYTKFVSVWRMW